MSQHVDVCGLFLLFFFLAHSFLSVSPSHPHTPLLLFDSPAPMTHSGAFIIPTLCYLTALPLSPPLMGCYVFTIVSSIILTAVRMVPGMCVGDCVFAVTR